MKKNFDFILKELNGKPATDAADKPIPASKVLTDALLTLGEKDRDLGGAEKVKRFQLAEKVMGGGLLDYSIDELTMIKDLVGRNFPPLAVGQIWAYLEKEPVAETPTEKS